MAAESVSRQAEFEACPEEGLWCISLRDSKYQALTTPSQSIHFDNSHHLSRVRVRLDWDEGTVEFRNADTDTHLFTFRHRFAEKVYPYFESISACGSLTVLTESVHVSMGPDHVPVEDIVISNDQLVKSEPSTERDINAASTDASSKIPDGCTGVTEDKNTAICSLGEEMKTKPLRSTTKNQLSKANPTRKEKTSDSKPAVKKQSSKIRFSSAYHVSLNKTLNILNNQSANHKQMHADDMKHST